MNEMIAFLFSGSGSVKLLTVGATAFLLGIAVTRLCFCLKKWQEMKNGQSSDDEDEEDFDE